MKNKAITQVPRATFALMVIGGGLQPPQTTQKKNVGTVMSPAGFMTNSEPHM